MDGVHRPISAYATARTSPTTSCACCARRLPTYWTAGAALVQLDEPVLSEVVFGGAKSKRTFMCGALSDADGAANEELAFAATWSTR